MQELLRWLLFQIAGSKIFISLRKGHPELVEGSLSHTQNCTPTV